LVTKSGLIDFSWWLRRSFGKHSPWGDEDSPALTAQLETALERELSLHVMRSGSKPEIRNVKQGVTVTVQGEFGNELFLVLDGIVRVEVDGERIAEYGPGSLHGERAVLEGGRRTSTVRAVTPTKLAVVPADKVERTALVELSGGHRREDQL
jgi:CRP-like cAMP-binding protein